MFIIAENLSGMTLCVCVCACMCVFHSYTRRVPEYYRTIAF